MNRKIFSFNNTAGIGRAIVLIGAAVFLVIYLIIALMRVSYPFELEWMEGGSVVNVQRILDGKPLYTEPSPEFVPFIYSPLYFYVSSVVAGITGNGFFPLRLVSLLSSVGCLILIYLIVRQRTGSAFAPFLASCLFAATFSFSGAWLDLARVDSLFLLLVLAGIYAFGSRSMFLHSLISPVLLFLAYLTKQTALPVAAFLAVAAFLTYTGRDRFMFAGVFILLVAASFLIMNGITDGWYKFYVFDLPSQHSIDKDMLIRFWTKDLATNLGLALCICAIPLLGIGAGSDSKKSRLLQDIFIFFGLFAASYISRMHSAGYTNTLIPVCAGIAIYFGIGIGSASKAIGKDGKLKIILYLAILLQFLGLAYIPWKYIPTDENKQQGEKLMEIISGFGGEVYLADHPWYLEKAGKPIQAQDMAVRDILRVGIADKWKKILVADMEKAVEEQKYDAFILDWKEFPLRVPDFEEHYRLVDSNLCRGEFRPVSGVEKKPTFLYVKREAEKNE